jgi:Mg2+-importing ATPase
MATSVAIMAFGMWLPASPFGSWLGFVKLPDLYWPILFATLIGYVSLTQLVKTWLHRRGWI